jgi:glutamine amidotransferase-like uncharacterized protein
VSTVPVRSAFIVAWLLLISAAFTACRLHTDKEKAGDLAPILLFTGKGTSPNDVAAVETVLESNHLVYSTANSTRLNGMSEVQLRGRRLLIVPGGNFVDIGKNLTATTTANIRQAVQNGLNYLGICAGGFFAGNSPYNGLNLTSGVQFHFYSAEARGVRKAAVAIAGAGTPALDQYWEDGPEFTGWGTAVGRYPDGTPAVVQGTFGNGWVVLSGVHPEAPADWRRRMTFQTPADVDHAYAAALIRAALNREAMPSF